MKITLVQHKYAVPLGDPCCYPLGFMMVAAVLKQRKHIVKVLNYNLWDYDLREELKGQDVAMFTGFEEFKPRIIADARIAREMGIKTILGGALATFSPEAMSPYVDVLWPGEFDDGTLRPDYDAFGIAEYFRRGNRHIGVLTSRGCPFSCTFCAQTCNFSFRGLDTVFAEIEAYKQSYGAEMIIFNDNTLNIKKGRWMDLCAGMRMPWAAAIRTDCMDDEMMRAAKQSGASYFVIGVESFKQDKLDRMNKRTTVDQIYRTLDLCHKHGIKYHGNILLGLNGETYDEIMQELASLPAGYNVFPALVQPFVGTKEGTSRAITVEQRDGLQMMFRDFVESAGMYTYPELGG